MSIIDVVVYLQGSCTCRRAVCSQSGPYSRRSVNSVKIMPNRDDSKIVLQCTYIGRHVAASNCLFGHGKRSDVGEVDEFQEWFEGMAKFACDGCVVFGIWFWKL